MDILDELSKQAVATIHEVIDEKGAMNYEINPLDRNLKLCGRAKTVKCRPNDNLTLVKAIHEAKRGDVLVVDINGDKNCGPFGEMLAVECLSKSVAGLVTNGSVRDSAAIIKRKFPVFSAGVCVEGTYKRKIGSIDQPVDVGGVLVRSGDYVLGDADGIVVIPPSQVEQAILDAEKREQKEAKIMQKLMDGKSLYDLYHYDQLV